MPWYTPKSSWKLPRPSFLPKVLWAAGLTSLGLSLPLYKMGL